MTRLVILSCLCLACLCGLLLNACSSPEDLVQTLAFDPNNREAARQELLLAKERAVPPLLEALDDPEYTAARPHLVESLLSLMVRVDDPRVEATLMRHLLEDPAPEVRARIARGLGLQRRSRALAALVRILTSEQNAEVRYEALLAIGAMEDRLPDSLSSVVDERARQLLTDPHEGTRLEAHIRVERAIGKWLEAASASALSANLAEAESLYSAALTYFPQSKRANYRLGRFYYDHGQAERGLQRLRDHGMVLDVPRLAAAPVIDGRLDDAAWSVAAYADSFYQLSHSHTAALPSPIRSRLYVGYTADALFIGFHGHDEQPQDLMVRAKSFDDNVWWEDVIEIFLDADFDHLSYVQVGITSVPVVADNWYPEGFSSDDRSRDWNADFEVAAFTGEDFWSIEYAVRFHGPQLPAPSAGDLWGFNLSRTYRNTEYAQWVRMSQAHAPDEFGILHFD